MSAARWRTLCVGLAAVVVAVFGLLVWMVPASDGERDWTGQLVEGGWMAWTFPVAVFFLVIATLLAVMTLLAIRYPETPRAGVLRIETTRGDRLFISLVGSAFINLTWLYIFGADGPPLWGALAVCLVYALAVFRWV